MSQTWTEDSWRQNTGKIDGFYLKEQKLLCRTGGVTERIDKSLFVEATYAAGQMGQREGEKRVVRHTLA